MAGTMIAHQQVRSLSLSGKKSMREDRQLNKQLKSTMVGAIIRQIQDAVYSGMLSLVLVCSGELIIKFLGTLQAVIKYSCY